MKIKYIILMMVLVTAVAFAGDSFLQYFTAKSSGNMIVVEWKSSDESSIVRYELERCSGDLSFEKIESFDATGNGSTYRHEDDNAFLRDPDATDKQLQEKTFQYRLKVIKSQNTFTYSNTIDVVHNISNIKRTWGMIKEMFR